VVAAVWAVAAEPEAELGLVVAGVLAGEGARGAEAAELGSVVAAVWAVAAEPEAAAAALAPVVEVVQEAARPEALLVQLVLRERRERRLEDG
jgi:hypothetical protein